MHFLLEKMDFQCYVSLPEGGTSHDKDPVMNQSVCLNVIRVLNVAHLLNVILRHAKDDAEERWLIIGLMAFWSHFSFCTLH